MKKFKIIIIIAAISALLIFAFNSCKTIPANCPDPVIKTDTIIEYNLDTIQIIKTDTIFEIDSIIITKDPVYIVDTVFKSIIEIDTVEMIVYVPEYILTVDTVYSVTYDTIEKLRIDTVFIPTGPVTYMNNLYFQVDENFNLDSARNIDDPLLKEFFRKFDSVNHNN